MNRSLAFALSIFAASVTSACGKQLDLGNDVPLGCEAPSAETRILSSLTEFPDFVPLDMVVVGDAAYLGGVSYPGRQYASDARDVGRLLRVPLAGGRATEVWRGAYIRTPLKTRASRIVFTEYDFLNVPQPPVFRGVNVYDTNSNTVSQIPNLPDRDYVGDFEITPDAVIFSAGTELPGTDYSVVRASFADANARPGTAFAALVRKRNATFARRGDDVLVFMPADGTESGYGDAESEDLSYAVFRVESVGLRLERRLSELTGPKDAIAQRTYFSMIHADDESYYVTRIYNNMRATFRLPRAVANPNYKYLASEASLPPKIIGSDVFWTPFADRSMVRTHALSDDSAEARVGTEVVFDARRQILAFAVDACRVTWLSYSQTGDDFRVMSAPRH